MYNNVADQAIIACSADLCWSVHGVGCSGMRAHLDVTCNGVTRVQNTGTTATLTGTNVHHLSCWYLTIVGLGQSHVLLHHLVLYQKRLTLWQNNNRHKEDKNTHRRQENFLTKVLVSLDLTKKLSWFNSSELKIMKTDIIRNSDC